MNKLNLSPTIIDLIRQIIAVGGLEIRKVPESVSNDQVENLSRQQQPFLYASGNWGPGYVTIKGMVSRKAIIRSLVMQLAQKVAQRVSDLRFVAGNVTGGQVPGWILSEYLELFLGRTIPYVYVRDMRKKGGQKELVTGLSGKTDIEIGNEGLVVEELVNFAQTTSNSAVHLRELGYLVRYAACVLFYGNPLAVQQLSNLGVEMIYLFTLGDMIDIAEGTGLFPQPAIDDYRLFLQDPLAWQAKRGLTPVKEGGTK